MNKLDHAFSRFNQALDRIEGILRRSAAAHENAPSAREIETLRRDNHDLAEELEQLRADYATLHSLSDEAETRIDTAMESIQKIMRA